MDATMTMIRPQVKGREQARVQWRVYRWIDVRALLAIACLILLSLAF